MTFSVERLATYLSDVDKTSLQECRRARRRRSPCSLDTAISAESSRMHLPQHLHDLPTQDIEVGINLRQVSRRLVLVEVTVERDLVADDADLLIPFVALVSDRSTRQVRAARLP